MKLFQKSLFHTGYFILKDGSVEPAFSRSLIMESYSKFGQSVSHVFGTNDYKLSDMCAQIREYKEKYGVVPRYLMDELRTGFSSSKELRQTKHSFIA